MFDEKLISAVLGAVAGAVAKPVADAAVSSWRERKQVTTVPKARLDSLLGSWEGTGKDTFVEDEKPMLSFTARMNVRKSHPEVNAEGTIEPTVAGFPSQSLMVSGSFYDSIYLQLTYRSSEPSGRIQAGVIVLALSPGGAELSGYYSGFSPTRRSFVTGTLLLRKAGVSPVFA